ncbi:DUF5627 domain-containing protein [Neolewinella lacunae]|uniref:DUF1735 domain-containing protein n=1 Tax=Neolewinella lacunae TaxID=1517758 RepID=A0A923T8R8_9BACT|nr:DUF5627 domain-containing protein [Neolewinella lacunae]MBC6994258.1 DUF1735 domain-containing protein [Neolewinella lacunae]MDN3637124.1 DUF5627 domain-containing protein [Neolewinella lacunae]
MKVINKAPLFLLLASLLYTGCENQEITFDDFDYTAVYFPLQSPLRTLVLGSDRIDNSLDNELKFNVGVSIGGLYTNDQEWTVGVDFAPELAQGLKNVAGDSLYLLPNAYIRQVSPAVPGQAIIPAGEYNALFEFQLEDAFLDDPLAWTGQYVLPLRLVETSADSILIGRSNLPNPDPRVASDWAVDASPKDFTLFGIKFVNQFHGNYLQRGRVIQTNAQGQTIGTTRYRANFLTQNTIWTLSTRGRNTVVTNGVANEVGTGFGMQLNISGNQITISPAPGTQYAVSGTGTFIPASESPELWGGTTHNTLHLNYAYTVGENVFMATDTLVIRDRNITFEEIDLVVVE